MSYKDPEQALIDAENQAVGQAMADWFAREPYIHAVYNAMPPEDKASVIEKIRSDATERGFMRLDAEKWLAYHVNQMFDEGKLPEIEKAQHAIYHHAQAAEDNFIMNGNKADVQRYLTAGYRDPAQAELRKQSSGVSTTDTIHPG